LAAVPGAPALVMLAEPPCSPVAAAVAAASTALRVQPGAVLVEA